MPRPKSVESEVKAAFERLKKDEPKRVPKGTPINLTNVALEADKQFRSDRYPDLAAEIKAHMEINNNSGSKLKKKSKESDKKKIKRQQIQIEKLTNIVLALTSLNEDLEMEVKELRSGSRVRKI